MVFKSYLKKKLRTEEDFSEESNNLSINKHTVICTQNT